MKIEEIRKRYEMGYVESLYGSTSHLISQMNDDIQALLQEIRLLNSMEKVRKTNEINRLIKESQDAAKRAQKAADDCYEKLHGHKRVIYSNDPEIQERIERIDEHMREMKKILNRYI